MYNFIKFLKHIVLLIVIFIVLICFNLWHLINAIILLVNTGEHLPFEGQIVLLLASIFLFPALMFSIAYKLALRTLYNQYNETIKILIRDAANKNPEFTGWVTDANLTLTNIIKSVTTKLPLSQQILTPFITRIPYYKFYHKARKYSNNVNEALDIAFKDADEYVDVMLDTFHLHVIFIFLVIMNVLTFFM